MESLIIIYLICNILAVFVMNSSAEIEIVNREGWNARPARHVEPMVTPVPYAVIHHSVMSPCNDTQSCINSMKEIQDFHMDSNGWDDIGYSFLIGGEGTIFEGRGWNHRGAHSPLVNGNSIGICLIGDWQTQLPLQVQLEAAKALIQYGVDNNWIIGNYTLLGHRDTRETECPGEALYQEILTWPHKGDFEQP